MKQAIIILTILCLLLVACEQKAQTVQMPKIEITTPLAKQLPDKPQYEPPPSEPYLKDVREIKIEATNKEFLPSEITATKGEILKLIFTSTDKEVTVILLEYGLKQKLPRGEDIEIEIMTKPGTYTFYNENDLNMKGKIIVK